MSHRLVPSKVLLGKLILQMYLIGISMPLFVHLLLWILVWQGMNYLAHESNPVRHEFLDLWKTFLVCWIFGGRSTVSNIFPLLFWGCMPYGICSVTYLVQSTIPLLHVVPMMLYILGHYGLLILSLVGVVVCSCIWIFQICACRLIGGDEI